jgi:hypothetical protein
MTGAGVSIFARLAKFQEPFDYDLVPPWDLVPATAYPAFNHRARNARRNDPFITLTSVGSPVPQSVAGVGAAFFTGGDQCEPPCSI